MPNPRMDAERRRNQRRQKAKNLGKETTRLREKLRKRRDAELEHEMRLERRRQRELNSAARRELQAFRDASIEKSRRASKGRSRRASSIQGGQGGPPPSIDFDLGADWPPQEISLDYDGGRVSSVNANIEKKYKHGGFIRRNPSTVNR